MNRYANIGRVYAEIPDDEISTVEYGDFPEYLSIKEDTDEYKESPTKVRERFLSLPY